MWSDVNIHDRKKSPVQDGLEWLRDELTDEAGKTEGGSRPYFLAERSWQLVPEHAAVTPTHNSQSL